MVDWSCQQRSYYDQAQYCNARGADVQMCSFKDKDGKKVKGWKCVPYVQQQMCYPGYYPNYPLNISQSPSRCRIMSVPVMTCYPNCYQNYPVYPNCYPVYPNCYQNYSVYSNYFSNSGSPRSSRSSSSGSSKKSSSSSKKSSH